MWEFDPQFVIENCLSSTSIDPAALRRPLSPVIRCEELRSYRGAATESASIIMFASLTLCTCIASASFVFRTEPIRSEPPWKRNHLWVGSVFSSLVLLTIYISSVLAKGSMKALPWYFFVLFLFTPFICLFINEKILKNSDRLIDRRNEMMRRLQFETKLGECGIFLLCMIWICDFEAPETEMGAKTHCIHHPFWTLISVKGMWSPKESQHVNIQPNIQQDDSPIV